LGSRKPESDRYIVASLSLHQKPLMRAFDLSPPFDSQCLLIILRSSSFGVDEEISIRTDNSEARFMLPLLNREVTYARYNFLRRHRGLLLGRGRLCMGVRETMSPWEIAMGSIMAIGLTIYLVYALLRPEKF
jgi:K+-transporting ATPase KdpF subunit